MTDEFITEIEKQKKTSFTVSSIPVSVLKEFKHYCKNECGDIYAVGIIQLLKTKEMFDKFLTAFDSKNFDTRLPKKFKTFQGGE